MFKRIVNKVVMVMKKTKTLSTILLFHLRPDEAVNVTQMENNSEEDSNINSETDAIISS